MDVKREVNGIVEWLREVITGASKDGCVVGVSGGIDSAVTVALCKLAFPDTTYGLSMPMEGNATGESTKRARILCNRLDIPLEMRIITPINGMDVKIPNRAKGNYYARQRMARLYLEAELNNALVIGTDNLCESKLGYFTKFGDGGVDLNPLGQFLKSEVYEMAKYLRITDEIINTPPSAELWDGQTDESELGFTYDDVENYLMNGNTYCTSLTEKISNMIKSTEHKRKMPVEYPRCK